MWRSDWSKARARISGVRLWDKHLQKQDTIQEPIASMRDLTHANKQRALKQAWFCSGK